MMGKRAFTLVELMLAVVLSSLVAAAVTYPLLNMFRVRTRLGVQSAIQAEMDLARDVISGEIRLQKNGSLYLGDEDADGNNANQVIRLGDVSECDLFEVDSSGDLVFIPNSGSQQTILTDVTAFETEVRYSPALHIKFAIKVVRDQVEVYREFVAAGRNEV